MSHKNHFTKSPEWGFHSASQMHWPSSIENRSEKFLKNLEDSYSRIIEELHFFEVIHLFVQDLKTRNRVMNKLSLKAVDLDRIIIHQKPVKNMWAGDIGPCFVNNDSGEKAVLNSIGSSNVNELPNYVSKLLNIKCVEIELLLKGISIEVNGEGVLLTPESLLMHNKLHLNLTNEEIEQKLKKYLGAERILWLRSGLSDDQSNDHDQYMVRWLNSNTVLVNVTDDPEHPCYGLLQENLERLRSIKSAPLKVVTISLPKSVSGEGGTYIHPGYTGFYIANGAVLVPQFNVENDSEALKLFKEYFSGRTIIPIDSKALAYEQGSIHGIINPWY
ncbi:agmatine deiminase family protein [Gracilimonas amylolytica]|uniref:agmatine deiminase family protein n=1 Tax=Gracilimonas amylolytica TaxID=1749045 RepID=UPI000CD8A023|nr:agmatine deiminase family protein [Gracilimonas amylolytica]